MDNFFSGLGTYLISVVISLLAGGVIGYKIGIKNNHKQIQKAGKNSHQTQIGNVINTTQTQADVRNHE